MLIPTSSTLVKSSMDADEKKSRWFRYFAEFHVSQSCRSLLFARHWLLLLLIHVNRSDNFSLAKIYGMNQFLNQQFSRKSERFFILLCKCRENFALRGRFAIKFYIIKIVLVSENNGREIKFSWRKFSENGNKSEKGMMKDVVLISLCISEM